MKITGKPVKKLQAAARRMPREVAAEYDDEPRMNLMSAFVVVALLHLVAVGGIYAFNSIKARRSAEEPLAASTMTATPPVETSVPAIESPIRGKVYQVQPGDTLIRIANSSGVSVNALEAANGLQNVEILRVGQELRIPAATEEAPKAIPKSIPKVEVKRPETRATGKTYTVVKGDNPVAIARKFEVNYSDLLKLNGIDDPRKLQIGQVLKIPGK